MKSITSTPESGFGSENWKRVWIYKHNLQVCGFPKTQSISTLSHWLLDMIFHRRSVPHSGQQSVFMDVYGFFRCRSSLDYSGEWQHALQLLSPLLHLGSWRMWWSLGLKTWHQPPQLLLCSSTHFQSTQTDQNWFLDPHGSSIFFVFCMSMATYCIPSLKLT